MIRGFELFGYLFGYRDIIFCREDLGRVAAALLSSGLPGAIREPCTVSVLLYRQKKYFAAFAAIPYTLGAPRGLPSLFFGVLKRRFLLAGVIVSVLSYILSSAFVWDVRVSGNVDVSEGAVINELAEAGLYCGAPWHSLSRDKVENTVLASSDVLGWISINRRGTVAYVRVKEKHLPSEVIDSGGYSNVVATEACVIEQITVTSGVAAVKVGDTVKAGDILISGIVKSPTGEVCVRACGEVRGRVIRENEVFVPRCETKESVISTHHVRTDVKIFNFSLNIFKIYGKSDNGCVIIEDEKEYTLGKDCRLPFSVVHTYALQTVGKEVVYKDSELITAARKRMDEERAQSLSGCDVLRISTGGSLSEAGYSLSSTAVVITSVGSEVFFYKDGSVSGK